MKKIKKISEHCDHHYISKYEVDYGMFQVSADVYSNEFEVDDLGKKLFSCDIQDVALDFSINGKGCKREGFKELYEKLYGEDSYLDFTKELTSDIEVQHLNLSDRPFIQNISVDKATEYLSELLTTSIYQTRKTMLGNKEIVYADKWIIVELAKVAEPDSVHRVNCKGTQSGIMYEHSIFDLSKYFAGE